MKRKLLLTGIFAAVLTGATSLWLFFVIYPSLQDEQKALQQQPQTRNFSLSELANSIKPIYPNATVIQGKLPTITDGIELKEVARDTISGSLVRDQKLGISKGIQKEGQAEITMYMASDPSRDHNIVAITLTNIGENRFFLKQLSIGGQTSRTGMAPLTASVLDSDYSPDVWGNIPKPVLTELIVMNPGDSISAYIKGKYSEEFTGELIDVFTGGALYYYDQYTEDYNSGFAWGLSVCSSQIRC